MYQFSKIFVLKEEQWLFNADGWGNENGKDKWYNGQRLRLPISKHKTTVDGGGWLFSHWKAEKKEFSVLSIALIYLTIRWKEAFFWKNFSQMKDKILTTDNLLLATKKNKKKQGVQKVILVKGLQGVKGYQGAKFVQGEKSFRREFNYPKESGKSREPRESKESNKSSESKKSKESKKSREPKRSLKSWESKRSKES